MKVAFFTSVLNHHQLPFCREMYKALGDGFTAVTTMPMEDQRRDLGYRDAVTEVPFGLAMYADAEHHERARRLALEADVLLAGVIPETFFTERMKRNRLTFRIAERLYKQGLWRLLSPRALAMAYQRHFRYRRRPLHLLCASAYTAVDAARILSYPGRKYKWGYFPEFRGQAPDARRKPTGNNPIRILWVGRFIDWKNPAYAMHVARRLTRIGISYTLDMIGAGPLRERFVQTALDMHVADSVRFPGALPPDRVREIMDLSDMVLCTSGRREGWGVVVNEAMNSACAVVVNREIGSVPYLIRDGENGRIVDRDNPSAFAMAAAELAADAETRHRLAARAYETIRDYWNAEIAARRLLAHLRSLTRNEPPPCYADGPMSPAERIG